MSSCAGRRPRQLRCITHPESSETAADRAVTGTRGWQHQFGHRLQINRIALADAGPAPLLLGRGRPVPREPNYESQSSPRRKPESQSNPNRSTESRSTPTESRSHSHRKLNRQIPIQFHQKHRQIPIQTGQNHAPEPSDIPTAESPPS